MSESDDQAVETEYFARLTKQMDGLLVDLLDTRTQLEQERQLFDMGPTIIFRWENSAEWPVEYVSNNVEIILGHKAQDLISRELKFSTLIHPDDIDNVTSTVNDFLQGDDEFFEIEYRIIDSEGIYHWLFHHAKLVNDRKTGKEFFIGYVLDITDRKWVKQS